MNFIVKVFLVLFFIVSMIKLLSCNINAGSYPYVEKYELNYSEEKIKDAINKFKQEHLEYIVPKVKVNNQGSWDLIDERTEPPSLWYVYYFYYKDENKILLTWTRAIKDNKTIFGFVSINEGLNLGNWKEINKDFNNSKNSEEKTKFENRILNKIKENLK